VAETSKQRAWAKVGPNYQVSSKFQIDQLEVGERARTQDRMADKHTDRQTDTSTDNKGRLELSGAREPTNGQQEHYTEYIIFSRYWYTSLTNTNTH